MAQGKLEELNLDIPGSCGYTGMAKEKKGIWARAESKPFICPCLSHITYSGIRVPGSSSHALS